MRRSGRLAAMVALTAAVVVAGVGCGVTTGGSVDRADPAKVPFGLLDTGSTVAADPGPTPALVDLYEETGRGIGLEKALQASFGFGEDELTARWRTRLSHSAS